MRYLVSICFFLLLGGRSMFAEQDSTAVKFDTVRIEMKQITDEDMATYRLDPKFDYEVANNDPTWWDDFKTWVGNLFLRFFEWLFGAEEAAGMFAIFLRVVPYILLVLLLLLLIKFFLSVNSRSVFHSQRNDALVSLSEEEQLIKNEDLQKYLQKAVMEKNYRLAIRYYYLYMLQLMSEKDLIVWELQKTNNDYLNELKKPELKQPFTTITRLYDYIWYGDFEIDEQKYFRAETAFSSLKKLLING